MRILIVEDDAHTRSALSRLLKVEGHETVLAFTAEAAMRLLSTEPAFDLVLLDIDLGSESQPGWAVAGFMQVHGNLRDVPIVIVSALDPDAIREGAKSYANMLTSAALIVGKPVDGERLLAAIARISG